MNAWAQPYYLTIYPPETITQNSVMSTSGWGYLDLDLYFTQYLNLLLFVTVNSTVIPLDWTYTYNSSLGSAVAGVIYSFQHTFRWPIWNGTLVYDPGTLLYNTHTFYFNTTLDLSVIANVGLYQNNEYGDGDSTDTLLISILLPVLLVAVIVVSLWCLS